MTKKVQKTIAQGNCLNKNDTMFPFCPVYYYFHGLHLDKLSEYALTEVKHRFSRKRWALSNSLKAISVQITFVIAAAKEIDLKPWNSVKIRRFP